MKNLILAAVGSILFISCDNFQNNATEEKKAESNEKNISEKNSQSSDSKDSITRRTVVEGPDLSISPANSYSDLFLDSSSIESFIKTKKPTDAVARSFRNFYRTRNYGFAWFTRDGLTEQAKGFWNLYEYSNPPADRNLTDKKLERRMDSLIELPQIIIPRNDSTYITSELLLTERFLHYLSENSRLENLSGKDFTVFIPAKKDDPLKIAEEILNHSGTNKNFDNSTHPFSLLKTELGKYVAAAKQGGWQPLKGIKNLKKGHSSAGISALKKRLQITGDLPGTDTSKLFNDSLGQAIKSFQSRIGLKSDGMISDSLIRFLNVPVRQRISQILLNLNRMMWMPATGNRSRIEVNIPAFMLTVLEGSQKAFDMPVVVGKEGTNTLMFAGDLNQIVFSPYWNVPPSIVRSEILPAMQKNPGYLKSRRMEIVKKTDSLPIIRQLPGEGNALGKIKFLFPNSFDIYFHDTEQKSVFKKQNRAVSHGCIRLADAEKMANYLLRDTPEWSPEKINTAMNSGKEQFVKLKSPVPVVITYYTVWVDEKGLLNFRNDVYLHDEATSKMMFTNTL